MRLAARIESGYDFFQTRVERGRLFPDADDLISDHGSGRVSFPGIYMCRAGNDSGCVHIVRKHPLDQFSEREYICAHIGGSEPVLFGSGYTVGAHQYSVFLFAADINLCRVVVYDFDHPVFSQHDIGGLQVAMNNWRLGAVKEGEPVADLGQDPDALLKRERVIPVLEDIVQRPSLHELFNDDQLVPIFAEGFDSGNVAALMVFQIRKNLCVVDSEYLSVE